MDSVKMYMRIALFSLMCVSLGRGGPAGDLVKELDQMPEVGKAF